MSQQHRSMDLVYDLMDRWRHLPAYQLERRADLFFAVFLPKFMSDRFGLEKPCDLLPEFPVRVGTIYPNSDSNKSYKIDYVAFSPDRSRIWFVELKTDSASRREEQDQYLAAAQSAGMPELLKGIIQISRATEAKHKYLCLLRSLEALGLVRLPSKMHDKWRAGDLRELSALTDDIKITCDRGEIEILYLQPHSTVANEIGFDKFADWLSRQDDQVARRFADSLRRWSKIDAGLFCAESH